MTTQIKYVKVSENSIQLLKNVESKIIEYKNVEDGDFQESFDIILNEDYELTKVCKCSFKYNGRLVLIENEILETEIHPLLESKEWFMRKLDKLKEIINFVDYNEDLHFEYLNMYLKVILDLKLNTTIIIDDCFEISCFGYIKYNC